MILSDGEIKPYEHQRHFASHALEWADIHLALSTLAGVRILLLEDEPLIALEVEDLCRESGAQTVVTHSNIDEAQSAIHDSFDIAVVDLILRGKSALPLAELIEAANTPIVFTTGGEPGKLLAQRFPNAPLLRKPYTGTELINALLSVLRVSGSV